MVQVIKSVAALAVLPEYYALCKYNLRCVHLLGLSALRAGA